MNTILLQPTDILFFRDGRPMGGASSGHGSAWPLPTVISHSFHAALHRASFQGIHKHAPGRSSQTRDYSDQNRSAHGRFFGSLTTAGPFPVSPDGEWFFPRPADADDSCRPVSIPNSGAMGASSLPQPSRYPVVSTKPPSKDTSRPWWNSAAWQTYLKNADLGAGILKCDNDFADTEHSYGIEISSESGSVVEGQFYSAHYLRLREGWRLGALALAEDKDFRHPEYGGDLVRTLLNGRGTEIIAGGQQRICTATLQTPNGNPLPLPLGPKIAGVRVKWVLLTPAIFPKIGEHPGGWLPSWVDQNNGEVRLLDGPGKNYAKRHRVLEGKAIDAHLVAAITGKPVPVTGYALPNSADPDRLEGGAKSTHLAVPAGAVYYFEAASLEAAQALANALNWHGSGDATTVSNRRSTLMGEKGFGLGVCGTWASPDRNVPGHPCT